MLYEDVTPQLLLCFCKSEKKKSATSRGLLKCDVTIQTIEKAFFLFHASAERGMSLAMYLLSGCYARGHGVPQNDQKAAEWLSNAKVNGDKEMCEFVTKWFNIHAP